MHQISRRSFLSATALAGAAFAMPAGAGAPLAGIQGPGVYRFKLGDYQLTALFDGVWYLPIDDKFVRNASGAEVNQALAAAFLPPGILPISFTALMVNTGAKLVLIDAGTAGQVADTAGSMLDNLKVAGIDPKAIDTILISHFHPDHIDGIKSKDGAKIFPNAEILVPEPEWTFWMDESKMGAAKGAVHATFSMPGASSRTWPGRCSSSSRAPKSPRGSFPSLPMAIRPATPLSPFIQAISPCWR